MHNIKHSVNYKTPQVDDMNLNDYEIIKFKIDEFGFGNEPTEKYLKQK